MDCVGSRLCVGGWAFNKTYEAINLLEIRSPTHGEAMFAIGRRQGGTPWALGMERATNHSKNCGSRVPGGRQAGCQGSAHNKLDSGKAPPCQVLRCSSKPRLKPSLAGEPMWQGLGHPDHSSPAGGEEFWVSSCYLLDELGSSESKLPHCF